MIFKSKLLAVIATIVFIFNACSNSPEKAESDKSNLDGLHAVIVNEAIPTSKYLYLNVREDNEQYWIATSIQEIEVGGLYYFSSGILKLNFESKEINRVFDKIYLVSSLVSENHASGHDNNITEKPGANEIKSSRKIEKENSVRISELVNNTEKYAGKIIQISGECVKINPNIMGRNWIHLKDGSKDDFDLIITSETFVPVGSVVTMTALVSLNKDFGAGYSYELILEDGVILP